MLEGETYKSWDMKAVREELYNGRYKVFKKIGELKVELGVEEKGKCSMMVKWRSRRCEYLIERSQLRKIHDQPFQNSIGILINSVLFYICSQQVSKMPCKMVTGTYDSISRGILNVLANRDNRIWVTFSLELKPFVLTYAMHSPD